MPPKRDPNKIIEREGINFVRAIVEGTNCIYHPIVSDDDLGNDCFIEFTNDNVATSFWAGVQVKSGDSYKDGRGYKIPASQNQLEYWSNFVNPIVGIVYDIDKKCAFWVNISRYLEENPSVLKQKHHNIRVEPNSLFSKLSFDHFRTHFTEIIKAYKSLENFGRSLIAFADFANPEQCYGGLVSLFSNHRNKSTAWLYMITSLEHIASPKIQETILGMLSNFTSNPDVFWNPATTDYFLYQRSETRTVVLGYVKNYFSEGAIKKALNYLNEGINRGSFAYSIFHLLNHVADIDKVIHKMATSNETEYDARHYLFWLYIHFAQHRSGNEVIENIDQFVQKYSDEGGMLEEMKEIIKSDGFVETG